MKRHQLYSLLYLVGLQLTIQLNPTVAQDKLPKTVVQLPKPPVAGIPDRRKPAGTRGSCEDTTLPFTPVLPNADPVFSGLTLKGHPTFWFYVPYHSSRVTSARFSIETEDEGLSIWRSDFQLPPIPGFVSVTLPKKVKALEEGRVYKWHFTIYCNAEQVPKLDSDREPSFVFHKGLIKRAKLVNPSPTWQSQSPNLPVSFYLENQLWYDAGNKLTEIRRSPLQWRLFLERMDMLAWREENVTGALYSTLP